MLEEGADVDQVAKAFQTSRWAVKKHVDFALSVLRERLATKAGNFFAQQWKTLERLEREAWALYRDLRETEEQSAAFCKCLETIDKIVARRIELLDRIAPKHGVSGDLIPVVEILVESREQVQSVLSFQNFGKIVDGNVKDDEDHTDTTVPPAVGIPKQQGEH